MSQPTTFEPADHTAAPRCPSCDEHRKSRQGALIPRGTRTVDGTSSKWWMCMVCGQEFTVEEV